MAEPTEPVSLLWPPDYPRATTTLSAAVVADLDLTAVVEGLAPEVTYQRSVRETLTELPTDPHVVRYRQEVIADLLDRPALARRLETVLPDLESLRYSRRSSPTDDLRQLVYRISQLEGYVRCVTALKEALTSDPPRSVGLARLLALVNRITGDEVFRRLAEDLPDLGARARRVAGVTVGINLDSNLQPVEATLLSLHPERFVGTSESLLGWLARRDGSSTEGLAPLHRLAGAASPQRGVEPGVLLAPLFRDLTQVMRRVARPVSRTLTRYAGMTTSSFDRLPAELAFLLGGVRLAAALRAATLPVCRPTITELSDRTAQARGLYNVALALRWLGEADEGRAEETPAPSVRQRMVPNELDFGGGGCVLILTGPNSGGKTTFAQAIGLLHVLAQAGLWVPALEATLSPVDSILTHFPAREDPEHAAGRLGEEAARLAEVFRSAGTGALVLLNEPLTSTSHGESLYLVRDIVRALRLLSARSVVTTHLHQLAEQPESAGEAGCPVVSLVSQVSHDSDGQLRPSFRIVQGAPLGRSYAREVAAACGIQFEQLEALLKERGVIPA